MTPFVWPLFAKDFLPQNISIPATKGKDCKLVAMGDRHTVVNARGTVIDRLLRPAHRCCGKKINRIAKDNGRRMAFAWQGDFPPDIVGFTPVDRRSCAWRNAIR